MLKVSAMTAHPPALCTRFHRASELIGRRWTGAVLYVLRGGAKRFGEIAAGVPGLTDRMLARVDTARAAVHRRANATRPRLQRPVKARPADPGAPSLEEAREIEAMKRVFRDLGVSYRRYRSQIGGPVAAGLRAATDRFRAEPSLPSLIAVAAILDQLDLLS